MQLSPQESRAGRALLGWTIADLANASFVSASTVKNFENELRETTAANLAMMRAAFEKAGVMFESDAKYVSLKIRKKK
jgi:transcriptional regulator with XRE-family HTH domain